MLVSVSDCKVKDYPYFDGVRLQRRPDLDQDLLLRLNSWPMGNDLMSCKNSFIHLCVFLQSFCMSAFKNSGYKH